MRRHSRARVSTRDELFFTKRRRRQERIYLETFLDRNGLRRRALLRIHLRESMPIQSFRSQRLSTGSPKQSRSRRARQANARQMPGRSAKRRKEAAERAALERLRANGLKLTPQRVAVVRELIGDLSHPTAQELFERLKKHQPTMSFATVYNTLDALVEAGLCHARALSPGATRFDPKMTSHDHAVCDVCGAIADIPSRAVVERPVPGFVVRTIEQVVRGQCARCASQSERKTHAERTARA
jgi:Fe2+ or Zn2+ uptake regulation protein